MLAYQAFGLRHSIDQVRSLALALVPILQHIFKPACVPGLHTFIINVDRDDVQPSRTRRLDSVHITKFLDKKAFSFFGPVMVLVPCIAERFDRLCEPVGRATCDDYLWSFCVRDIRMHILASEMAEVRVKRRVSLRKAILKCGFEINLMENVGIFRGLGNHYSRRDRFSRRREARRSNGWWVNRLIRGRLKAVSEGRRAFQGIKWEIIVVWEALQLLEQQEGRR